MTMFNLALALERLGRYEEALEWIRKALAVEPDDASLQKLEFRLRLLKLRSRVGGWFKALWPFGRRPAGLE